MASAPAAIAALIDSISPPGANNSIFLFKVNTVYDEVDFKEAKIQSRLSLCSIKIRYNVRIKIGIYAEQLRCKFYLLLGLVFNSHFPVLSSVTISVLPIDICFNSVSWLSLK